jgi:hypothetical protein
LSLGFSKVGLEIGANAFSDAGRSLGALDDEPRPERLCDRLFQKLRQAKGQASDGVRDTEPGWCEQVVEAVRELGSDRGGQLLDALEVIVEGALRDPRGVHDGVNREGFGRPLGEQYFRRFQDLRTRSGALLASNLGPPRQIALAGCSNEKAEAPAIARPARVVIATPHKFATVAQGAGVVGSRYVSQVGFEVGGRLISRDVDVGALVRKGQKLASLSATDYRNKATAAEADLVAANAALAQAEPQELRFRTLLQKGFATRAAYDNAVKALQSAQAQVQSAGANLRIAQNQLGYTELLA